VRDVRFTTSWDDGHPLDLRIAELLAKYELRGTFYVPRRNREGRAVLGKAELRELAAHHEIGGHTFDHVRLSAASLDQIRRSKTAIEDELGRAIDGFCYPGGVHDAAIRAAVRDAGFCYARTIENLRFDVPRDPFQLATTLQFYPHSRLTYVKNLARGHLRERARGFACVMRGHSLVATTCELLEAALASGTMFHLWGHSWELQEHGLWGELEAFFAFARDRVPRDQRVDNAALIASTSAASKLASVKRAR
jgi:peptidoglycan-N-acetylglucosamine deacetylase